MTGIFRRRVMSRGLVTLSALAFSLPVAGYAQAAAINFNIPSQDLGSALRAFGKMSNQQVSFNSANTRGKLSAPVKGQFAPDAALRMLLSKSGLTFQRSAKGVLLITPAGMSPASEAVPLGAGAGNAETSDIVVTGSRIARKGYDQPTPVNVVSAEEITRSGFSNVSDILNRTTQVGVGLGSANSYYNVDAGASFINLRGLGTNRTLVLVNGRRRVSGTQLSSAVDLTTIPANLIDRIEVITGGAAAVYGADAVTGVVNVTLKQELEGVELTGRTGISSRGDAASRSLGLAVGGNFADGRGRFLFGASYNKEDLLMAKQRPFGRKAVDLFGNPANTGPDDGIFDSVALTDYRYPNTSYGGAFMIGGTRYTYDGGVRPTMNDTTFNSGTGIGGDGFNDADFAPLRNASEVFSTMLHVEYQLADPVRFFGDFQYSRTKTDSPLQPSFDAIGTVVLTNDNPLIPDDVLALMDANGQTTLGIGRTNFDQGPNHRLIDRDTFTVVGGLEGDLGQFHWTGFYQYGRYEADIRRTHERIQSRYLEAVDVIAGPDGTPICRSASARAAGCVPLNLFGRDAATPEAMAYFDHTQRTNVVNTQQVGGLQLTGPLFELPAGAVQFAGGVEYRKETLDVDEDPLAEARLLQRAIGDSLSANFDVREVFGEVLVPLLADQPFARELSLEGAVRYSDYSTVGGTVAWKLGAQYAPSADIRFRVTRSRSVRAPNLAELNSPGTTSSVFILDPCDATRLNLMPNRAANCAALGLSPTYADPFANQAKQVITKGNPELSEEKSDSWTVGAVLTPRFLPGLSASVDFFQIKIEDAVNVVAQQRLVDQCVDVSGIDNPFCEQITRRADGGITSVNVTPINIGKLTNRGIDFQANYAAPLGNAQVRLAVSGTYLMKNDILVVSTDPTTLDKNAGEVDNPKWRVNVTPGISVGRFSLDWTARFIDSTNVDVQLSDEARDDNRVSSRFYNDLTMNFDVDPALRLYAGINNMFDVAPPFSRETVRGDKRGVLFDNIGRYFFLGATTRF